MLVSLRISHLALVEQLSWELSSGLTAITGETGAGKSMILGALKLLLGERADRSLIRNGENKCNVEALFQLEKTTAIDTLLEQAGLDACNDGELLLSRSFDLKGANRQFINGSPATLSLLKKIGVFLVDLHGPHDHQSLLRQEAQLDLLTNFSKALTLLGEYQNTWREWRAAKKEYEELLGSEQTREQELTLLRHQYDEIANANIDPKEEEGTLARYEVAQNSTDLIEYTQQSLALLSEGDTAALPILTELHKTLREIEKRDAQTASILANFESVFIELQELESTLSAYRETVDFDPEQVLFLKDRVDLLESLKRKYGNTLEEVITYAQNLEKKLHAIENRDETLKTLQKAQEQAHQKLLQQGKKLSRARQQAAPKLAKNILSHLQDLGFSHAQFEVALETLETPSAHGLETTEFLFAANAGEPIKPLRNVASSGEISRLMLAVKSALATQDATPLLIFDEIDANVGGEIAKAVGAKMKTIAENHQVIAITHLPQVAACAEQQFHVSKEVTKDKRTRTSLATLNEKQRITEIARMLGGGGKSAEEHAKNLLKGE